MGRRKSKKNKLLPDYVFEKRGSMVYKPYLGRENGKTKWGTPIVLCSANAPISDLWQAYERAIGESVGTLKWLLKQYHAGKDFPKLAKRTQGDYENYQRLICQQKGNGGQHFGDATLESITKRTIRQYLDNYGHSGTHAPVAANRHIQYLKAAWNWVEERHSVPENPCIGVKLNEETPRERLVTDDEYIEFAMYSGGYIELFMGIAYLSRARWSEIARLTEKDLTEEGLILRRGKGSDDEVTLWSPMLRRLVKACAEFNADIREKRPTPIKGWPLIHNRKGQPINQNAFQTAWGRKQRAWAALGKERFTFHDLKAMGVSAQEDNYSGHRSDKMQRQYNKRAKRVAPPV